MGTRAEGILNHTSGFRSNNNNNKFCARTVKEFLGNLPTQPSAPSPILLLCSPVPWQGGSSHQLARGADWSQGKTDLTLSSSRTAAAQRLQLPPPTSSSPSKGRMKGLFTSPEKLRATTELLLNRHSARKSVPVSSCLFSGLAVMDYIQPQVGHKPAVYLSLPNILLQFLYYRGANALFQDAYCIKSTYFSEYFTVTQRDWTGFFYQMLLLLPQHIPHNKSVSVPRGLQLKWQTALQLFPAQKPTGRETCAPHSPTLLTATMSGTAAPRGPAVFPSWTRGGKKEKHSQHFPPGPSHKH